MRGIPRIPALWLRCESCRRIFRWAPHRASNIQEQSRRTCSRTCRGILIAKEVGRATGRKRAYHKAPVTAGTRDRPTSPILPIGSRRIDKTHGYVMEKTDDGGWRQEHILVMERKLGHPLPRGSNVHHIDGNRTNNDEDNLFLCRDSAHHMQIEHQMKAVFREFLRCGDATFCRERGIYVVN